MRKGQCCLKKGKLCTCVKLLIMCSACSSWPRMFSWPVWHPMVELSYLGQSDLCIYMFGFSSAILHVYAKDRHHLTMVSVWYLSFALVFVYKAIKTVYGQEFMHSIKSILIKNLNCLARNRSLQILSFVGFITHNCCVKNLYVFALSLV